jgi:retron-type reverse transcriptase
MYESFRHRDRPIDRTEAHSGPWRRLLRYHRHDCFKAARTKEKALSRELAARLVTRVADERNVRAAIDHIADRGGDTPGPDGVELGTLHDEERWQLARLIRRLLSDLNYTPGPTRTIRVPKSSGTGYRSITLFNAVDRVVQRAVVQILQPFLGPSFARDSFGSRPGRGREHALARLNALMRRTGNQVLLVEDIRDAFTHVPIRRLFQILRSRVPTQANALFTLLERMIGGPSQRGLAQGSPLSPLLMNLYLDHLLDRPWKKRFPERPLIRVVDDLLVLTGSREQASEARDALVQRLRAASMPLKGSPGTAVRDLATGESVTWLGYSLRQIQGSLVAELPEEGQAWIRLEVALRRAHERAGAALRARELILGWLAQQGPCFASTDRRRVYRKIEHLARSVSFTELPTRDIMERSWSWAHLRWEELRDDYVEWG